MASVKVEGRLALVRDEVVLLAVAASVFVLAFANGGFATTTRAWAAIAVWWLLAAGAALAVGSPGARISRPAVAAPCLLALFALWVVVSSSWAPDAERAFAQFDQVSLYVGVLVLGIVLARRVPVPVLVSGVALGLAALAAVALASRLFPGSFATPGAKELAELGYTRLSFPLGYWNGLGIELALAYPLLLAVMSSRRSRLASTLASLPLPLIAADLYLTSSRGAFATAAVAVCVYLALSVNRWTGLAAAVLSGVSAAVVIRYLVPRKALVDGRMQSALAVHQGHRAALVIGVVAIGGALVWLGAIELARRLPSAPSALGWTAVAAAVVGVCVLVVAAHPLRRFEAFKHVSHHYRGSRTYIENHLLSGSGSGRWQLWTAAVTEFRRHPLLGGGAGSWESWWLQHGSLPSFSQFAHSLYLEALGELGIVGLVILAAAVIVAVAGAVRSCRLTRSAEVAGVAACGVAFFVAASFDWVWQLASVASVGIGTLGVALGVLPSTRSSEPSRTTVVQSLFTFVALVAIAPQVVALVAGIHLRRSQADDAARNGARARAEALAARAIEPWAASPYLQLALIDQQELRFGRAGAEIAAAVARSKRDWSLWLAAAQIDTYRGRIAAARRDLARVHALDPRFRISRRG